MGLDFADLMALRNNNPQIETFNMGMTTDHLFNDNSSELKRKK